MPRVTATFCRCDAAATRALYCLFTRVLVFCSWYHRKFYTFEVIGNQPNFIDLFEGKFQIIAL